MAVQPFSEPLKSNEMGSVEFKVRFSLIRAVATKLVKENEYVRC
jgi:hypothetical protein